LVLFFFVETNTTGSLEDVEELKQHNQHPLSVMSQSGGQLYRAGTLSAHLAA